MNRGEIIEKVREDYLADVHSNPDQNEGRYRWPSAFLSRCVTEAEKAACRSTDLLFDNTTAAITQITLATTTADYTISAKITRIEAVIYDDEPLVQMTDAELLEEYGEEWRTETGEPVNYRIKGRTITFVPEPTSDENGDIVYLDVYRLPANSYSDPEIPEEYHEGLCSYVAYLAYKRRDEDTYDPKKASEMLAEFRSIFGFPDTAEVRRKHLEQPRNTRIIMPSPW